MLSLEGRQPITVADHFSDGVLLTPTRRSWEPVRTAMLGDGFAYRRLDPKDPT